MNYKPAPWIVFSLALMIFYLTPCTTGAADHQSWSYNLSVYEVNVRQYTAPGTFTDLAGHLERLKEMGAGILWFMPVHPIGIKNRLGSLGSYYSVRDYLEINAEFGTLTDFKTLVDSIHALGMYAIMDWVGNHTAWDNPLTVTHPEWYVQDGNGNFIPPPGTGWSDVIQLDYSKPALREYMINAMTYWIQETDIDGFRCDAVGFMPLDFWSEAIGALKGVKPEIIMLAENDSPQYSLAGFDATYAWGLHGFGNGVLRRIASGTGDAAELSAYILNELDTYSGSHYRMYFTSNHDENSWYGTVFEQFGAAAESFAVLTATLNGLPLIYGGQEAGLNKRLLFFDKDQIPWQPHPFADLYRTLLHLKKRNMALWNGSKGGQFQQIRTTNDRTIFAFTRARENDKVLALFNFSIGYNGATLQDTLFYGTYTDVFTGDTVSFYQSTSISIPAWGYRIYEQVETPAGIEAAAKIPQVPVLDQNYPNPFNTGTAIRFRWPEGGLVLLKIYDLSGREVRTLVKAKMSAGEHTVRWDGKDRLGNPVASGIYICQLKAGNSTARKRMVMLR